MPAFLTLVFLVVSGAMCWAADPRTLARLGGQMDAAEKDALEEQIEQSPQDIDSRTKLLGYYFSSGRQDPDAAHARKRHVLWLVENAPESGVLGSPYGAPNKILEPEGYREVEQAWLKVTREPPENLAALANAASFFLLHDRDLAEELLLKGQQAEQDSPSWAASLGHLYALNLPRLEGPARRATAEKALRQFELAYARSEPNQQQPLLRRLAKAAFDAGLHDEAKRYAEMMLDDDTAGWNQGNQVHHGNLILGRVALANDDVEEAKSRLLLAGKTTGSPQLNSFGPNMALAKDLLERGETAVVLEYFALCAEFWNSPRRRLEQWTEDVKADRVPEFGANLVYYSARHG